MNEERESCIVIGDSCYLDINREIIMKNGFPCSLSRTEFRLLHCLAMKLGELVTIDELTSYVWMSTTLEIQRHELHVFINKLRYKLKGDPDLSQSIACIRNIGYVFKISPSVTNSNTYTG